MWLIGGNVQNGNNFNCIHIDRFGVSKEKAGLPETLLFKRVEGGTVEEVARWVLKTKKKTN